MNISEIKNVTRVGEIILGTKKYKRQELCLS